MRTKDDYKVMEGDIVEFKRFNSWTSEEEVTTQRGVVIEHSSLIEQGLTVVVSLFPYSETRLYKTDFKVIEKSKEGMTEYNVGDLVRLRGSENVLYIENKFEIFRINKTGWTYNVKEIRPSTGRKSRFVQSCLLERAE